MSTGLRAGTNNDGYLQVNGTDVLTALSSGRIGVGTTNPYTTLHVVSSGVEQVRLTKNGAEGLEVFLGNNTDVNLFQHYNRVSNTWVENRQNALRHTFANSGNGNEVFRIESNGNVGIGTTNPLLKLDTRGALHVGGGIDGIWLGNAGDNSAYDNVKLYYTGYNGGDPRVYLTPRTQPGSGTINTFLHLQSNVVGGPGANNMGLLVDGTVSIGTSTQKQKLTVNGDIGIYKGSGQTRIFTVKGAAGTFSTLTITVNQYDYGSFVYDLKMHGYAGSYLHYAGGAYENGGIFSPVTTIAQKSPSATFTGPTYVSGHTWTITVTYASAWIHPVAEFSISGGGNFESSESDITMVWS